MQMFTYVSIYVNTRDLCLVARPLSAGAETEL